jgi:Uma2 family endonuclease
MAVTPISNQTQSPVLEEAEYYNPPPSNLPVDDGEPLETKRHRTAMNILIRSLDHHWEKRNDYFAGGNMFVYFSREQVKNKDFRGPDFFVVLNIDGSYSRQTWTVWDEGGRYPDVIVELMSSSTAETDLGKKKEIYQNIFRTPNYFVFNPFEPDSLQGWYLQGTEYQSITANEEGWLWCDRLQLWLGTWSGIVEKESAQWLRFYDTQKKLILLPEEAAQQQADAAQQQAQVEKLRSQELEAKLKIYQEQFGELPL